MMTIYLQKSKRGKPRKTAITIGVIVMLLLFVGLLQWLFGSGLSTFTLKVGSSVSTPFAAVGKQMSYIGGFISSRQSLIKQNQKIRDELDQSKAKLMNFDSLAVEHEALLKAYGRSTLTHKILASVMVKPPQSPYDTLALDVGSEQGVSKNNRVFGMGGVVLGGITEIGKNVSRTELYSSPGKETRAIVQRTDESLMLIGMGGGNFEARVAQEVDVLKSDSLILPGLRTPLLGVVVEVEVNPASAYKKVLVRVPISIFNIRWVEVELSPEAI